jgi:hypothetical protein
MGSYAVSYTILLKTFDRFLYSRPIPDYLPALERNRVTLMRYRYRGIFAALVAPMMVLGIKSINPYSLKDIFKVNVDLTDSTSASGFGFLFLKNFIKPPFF